jgi:nucleotidyltransferase substrate binding protein (TIGR01987 family)
MHEQRWEQRLEHLMRAQARLQEAAGAAGGALSELEQEGLAQRFEYTFELAWKTLKDYLAFQGIALTPPSPRQAIKEAYALGILSDGALWLEMLDRRNWLTHAYDEATFRSIAAEIRGRYAFAIAELVAWLTRQGGHVARGSTP